MTFKGNDTFFFYVTGNGTDFYLRKYLYNISSVCAYFYTVNGSLAFSYVNQSGVESEFKCYYRNEIQDPIYNGTTLQECGLKPCNSSDYDFRLIASTHLSGWTASGFIVTTFLTSEGEKGMFIR